MISSHSSNGINERLALPFMPCVPVEDPLGARSCSHSGLPFLHGLRLTHVREFVQMSVGFALKIPSVRPYWQYHTVFRVIPSRQDILRMRILKVKQAPQLLNEFEQVM